MTMRFAFLLIGMHHTAKLRLSISVREGYPKADVRKYLQHLIQQKKSDSYVNQAVNAIKFYYEVVQGMPNRFYSIESPRKQERLPEVLSKEEIIGMIKVTKNLKHRCMISLLYSAGLRRGELLRLKATDKDSQQMLIRITQGKGKERSRHGGRYTLLSGHVLAELRQYYRQYLSATYLFEGPKGQPYSGSGVVKIVTRAAPWAGLKKGNSIHATTFICYPLVGKWHRFEIYSNIIGS